MNRIKRTRWLNIYPDNHRFSSLEYPVPLYDTRAKADLGGTTERIACIEIAIECEVGAGL